MANTPTRLNNPGDLKDPKTGTFRAFSSPEEGFTALKNDLQAKISGNTSTGLSANSSLKDFAGKYAPDSDGNNSSQYAEKLAKKLGVNSNTSIGSLSNRLDDFASAISDNEGYQGQKVLGASEQISPVQEESMGNNETIKQNVLKLQNAGATPEDIETYVKGAVQDVPKSNTGGTFDDLISAQNDVPPGEKPNLVQAAVGANPKDSVYGQIVDNKLTHGLVNLVPGAQQLGNQIGTSLAWFGEKAKGLLGGQDNSKYIPENDTGEALKGAAKVIGTAASIATPGILAEAANPLAAKEIAYNIPMEMSEFSKLGATEKLNVLGEAFKTAEAGDAEKIAQAIKYLKPSQGFIKDLLGKGFSLAKGLILTKALGDTVGGFIHRNTGK